MIERLLVVLLVLCIAPVDVGHDIQDSRFCRSTDKCAMCVRRDAYRERDDEELLVFEGCNDRGLVVVGDEDGNGTVK